jgi:hypothetical protein
MVNPGYTEGTYLAGEIQITSTAKSLKLQFPMQLSCPSSVVEFVLRGQKTRTIKTEEIQTPVASTV